MAGALPLPGQNEKGIMKFLRCPICFEFPKDKVFQCKKGHSLCSSCYQGCSDCPFCGCRLDQDDPIRNFSLEEVLDNFVEVDCSYKVNGCGQLPKRGLIQAHQSKCHFNFEKFGKLVNVCKLIGYKDCDFEFNNGSTEDAVKHYVSAHGCEVVSTNHFQIELTSLPEVGFNNECFWTPIISDLKNCFLLTFAIRNRNDGLTCVSLSMPKLNETCQAPVMQYSFHVTTKEEEPLKYGFHRSCIDLRKVESPNRLVFSLSNSQSHFTNGSLLIDCLVQGLKSCNETDKIKPERIVCSKITTSSEISSAGFLRWNEKQIECHGMRTCSKFVKKLSEILVTNLPDNPDLLSIMNVFSQFGEIISFEKLENVFMPEEEKCEGVIKMLIIRFADPSSVETLLTKKCICLRHNGKWQCLKVTTTDIVNVRGIGLKDEHLINTTSEATTFIDKAQKACMMSRDALKEYILTAFSKTGDPTIENYLKKMMSIMAAEFGSLESMELCIENGINVNLVHFVRGLGLTMSLLCYALKDTNKKVGFEKVKLLVENGADVHFKNTLGCSMLHISVPWGSVEAVKFFLEKGLEVNACNPGWTPLHAALTFRATGYLAQKVKLLLDYGADVNVKDKYGKSVINYVQDFHNEEIQEMFRNHLQTLPNAAVEN